MSETTIAESAETLRLSNRTLRILSRADITTVSALARLSDWEIADLPSVGPVAALEIAAARNLAAGLADAETAGASGTLAQAEQLARIADALEAMSAAPAINSTPPPPPAPVAEYMTLSEAATALGVTTRTVANMLNRGDLTRYKFGPKRVRLLRSEVYAAITPQEVPR